MWKQKAKTTKKIVRKGTRVFTQLSDLKEVLNSSKIWQIAPTKTTTTTSKAFCGPRGQNLVISVHISLILSQFGNLEPISRNSNFSKCGACLMVFANHDCCYCTNVHCCNSRRATIVHYYVRSSVRAKFLNSGVQAKYFSDPQFALRSLEHKFPTAPQEPTRESTSQQIIRVRKVKPFFQFQFLATNKLIIIM